MRAPASAEFKSIRYLKLENLPCCTQLPDGLCCLPSLELLTIIDAPAIKRIGPQFQASSSLAARGSDASTSAPFPKLRNLQLIGLCEWEEWEWNDCEEHMDVETAIAMPCLETLQINNCKLSCLPPGLASSKRHNLRKLNLYELSNQTHVENIPSVVKLDVFDCPELKRISGLAMLQKIRITCCPKLEVLEGVPALDSLRLEDATMAWTRFRNTRELYTQGISSCIATRRYTNPPYHRVALNGRRSAILENATSTASKIQIQVRMDIQRKTEDSTAPLMIAHALR